MISGSDNEERDDYPSNQGNPPAQIHSSDVPGQISPAMPNPNPDGVNAADPWPTCSGPGRKGVVKCGNPVVRQAAPLCASNDRQLHLERELVPLRTRKSKAPCVGPCLDGGPCGRRVYFREPGQDDGVCKSHYDQIKRRGWLSAIAPKHAPVPDCACKGPGQDGSPSCDRKAECGSGYCAPHDRQYQKTGNLKAIRRTNTPDGPCLGPGEQGTRAGSQ